MNNNSDSDKSTRAMQIMLNGINAKNVLELEQQHDDGGKEKWIILHSKCVNETECKACERKRKSDKYTDINDSKKRRRNDRARAQYCAYIVCV